MKRYAIYNKVTGQIIKWGVCATRDFGKFIDPDQGVLELSKFTENLDTEYKVLEEKNKRKLIRKV